MKNHALSPRLIALSLLVLLAAMSRLLPHPPNFTPIAAIALFGAAYIAPRWLAVLLPLVSLWLSDLFLNNIIYSEYNEGFVWFTGSLFWIYGSFLLISLLGFFALGKISAGRIAGISVIASVLFFLISNFGVWVLGGMYPLTASGLIACYTAAIPFFGNTLLGDLCYTGTMFASFALLQKKFPSLQFNQ